MLQLSDEEWKKVVFTDESLFERGTRQSYVRFKNPNMDLSNFAVQTSRWGPRCMVWGAITYYGPFGFSIIKGKTTAKTYKELLEGQLGTRNDVFRSGELYFQQDGASSHTAKVAVDDLKKSGIIVVPWPAFESDRKCMGKHEERTQGYIQYTAGAQ
jgi:hypothetical protein